MLGDIRERCVTEAEFKRGVERLPDTEIGQTPPPCQPTRVVTFRHWPITPFFILPSCISQNLSSYTSAMEEIGIDLKHEVSALLVVAGRLAVLL